MPRISACSPPARTSADAVVAHPPLVGSEVGISHLLRFVASRAICRAAYLASFSSLRRLFAAMWKYSLMLPISTTAMNAMAYMPSTGPTSIPFIHLFLWWSLVVAALVVALAIFHWLLVPLFHLLAARLS